MKILVVAAHPDDEALGAGATLHNICHNGKGDEAYVCLLSHWSPTRDDDLLEGIKKSHKILGIKKSYIGDFGCMQFAVSDHHQIVRFIETAIRDCKPDIIITHHPSDVHIDHGVTAECCMEAAKLPQRKIDNTPDIKNVCFMEVLSSTDWNINHTVGGFTPNTFFPVTQKDIEAKYNAINVYEGVVRDNPHPRSKESLTALATIRGSQSGTHFAEAFQSVFRIAEGGV